VKNMNFIFKGCSSCIIFPDISKWNINSNIDINSIITENQNEQDSSLSLENSSLSNSQIEIERNNSINSINRNEAIDSYHNSILEKNKANADYYDHFFD